MRSKASLFSWVVGCFVMVLSVSSAAVAQELYPDRSVRLVVPFPPGGPTDVFGRIVAAQLSDLLAQPVIVDNRAGASGIVGTEHVARSKPDGYTLLFGTAATHAINPTLYRKLPYDAVRDFEPVAFVGVVPQVLLVHPSLPDSLDDLLSLLRENPGRYTYASAGSGTTTHLTGELLKSAAGLSVLHVPYKGSAPALQDVMGGQVHYMFESFGTSLAHIEAGRLKPVAVAAKNRSTAAPSVPTFGEAGLEGFEAATWNIVAAPAGTPADVIQKLNGAVNRAMRDPGTQEQLMKLGIQAVDDSTPSSTVETIRQEAEKWAVAVKASGAKLD